MYGGRAIDDFDRRVLKTYMDEYMGDFIFDTFQPFHFFKNVDVDYCIPEDGNKDTYVEAIEALPLANTPEVFGLHSNAEIGYFTRAAKDMWSQLIELQPQTGESGSGISREEFIANIASDIQVRRHHSKSVTFITLILLQSKLPELYKLDVIRKQLGDVISPTTIVLLQELERFNKLIKRISVSLSNLQKVNSS